MAMVGWKGMLIDGSSSFPFASPVEFSVRGIWIGF